MFGEGFWALTLEGLVGLLITAIGIWLVVKQLTETKLATQMEGLMVLGQLDVENAAHWAALINMSDNNEWDMLSPDAKYKRLYSSLHLAEAFDAAYTFFELMGSVVYTKALSMTMVQRMYGWSVNSWWERLGQVVIHRRKVIGNQELGANWEWLAREFQERNS